MWPLHLLQPRPHLIHACTLRSFALLVLLVLSSGAWAAPAIVSPAPGSTLPAGAAELVWQNDATPVAQWWVQIGRTAGGKSLADVGPLPATTDRHALDPVPEDGGPVHLRLWYRAAGAQWRYTDASWTAPGNPSEAGQVSLISPTPGAALEAGTHEFAWRAGGGAVTDWWLYVGSTPGAKDVVDSGALAGTVTSFSASGLPVDGRTLHARLWYRDAGDSWRYVDSTTTAAKIAGSVAFATPTDAVLAPGAPLAWEASGRAASDFWVYLGDAAGGATLGNSGRLAGGVSSWSLPTGLPTDGRPLHARLWYRYPGEAWTSVDRRFTASGQSVTAALIAPEGGTLGGGPQTFSWDAATVQAWWLYVGTSPGAKDLHDSGSLAATATSRRVAGLPADGNAVHARLWYRTAGVWRHVDRRWNAPVTAPSLADYELAFSDEFEGDALDPDKWNTGLLWGPYVPINNEEQLYVDTLGMHASFGHSPFEVSGGTLKITATAVDDDLAPPARPAKDDSVWGDFGEYRHNYPYVDGDGVQQPGYREEDVNYLSGIITSYDSFKFARGYVEARAKLPAGRGLWPAFWALNAHYVEDSPEIDVMEFLGQYPDRVYHTYHYFQPENDWAKVSTPSFETRGEGWTTEFHTYGMEWSPRQIIWYVDGVETRRVTDAEYDISRQAMYLLANLAVGGSWPGAPDASTAFPATYELDYIRAYRRVDPEPVNLEDFQLVFEDDFDGDALDPDKWNTEFLWGPYFRINAERQYYVNTLNSDADKTYSPFEFDDGVMSIVARPNADSGDAAPPVDIPGPDDPIWEANKGWARPDSDSNPYDYVQGDYTSGLITSRDSFMFAYGYAEARVQLPRGDGLWPAFWLLNSYYIAQQPEIDIMEARGSVPDKVWHNYHRSAPNGVLMSGHPATPENPKGNDFETTTADGEPDFTEAFHTFGVRWSPEKITWYVDGEAVHSISDGTVGYQLMYVLANLAVGGNYPYRPVDDTALPAALKIDWIRVYQERELR